MLAFNSELQKPTADFRKISSTNIILIEGSVVKGINGVLKDKQHNKMIQKSLTKMNIFGCKPTLHS